MAVTEKRATRALRALPSHTTRLDDLLSSYLRWCRASNDSEHTLRAYRVGVRRFILWRERLEMPTTVASVTRADVERYLTEQLVEFRPNSVRTWHTCLVAFFHWCVNEGEVPRSPLEGIRQPRVAQPLTPIPGDDALRALLHTCEGRDWKSRRDLAILRILLDTGMRRTECATILLANLDLERREVTIHGKGQGGGKDRTVAFHHKTALALDRYLRVRPRHRLALTSPRLWLSHMGELTGQGVWRIVAVRCQQAHIPHLHPHTFRHYFSHHFLKDGGSEGALMQLNGWTDMAMTRRYGAALASERARDETRKQTGGDRL